MKIFTLNSKVFVQSFDKLTDIIIWTDIWNGELYFSQSFKELIDKYYNEN